MIKRIRVMLDYGCYPVWLYDEDDNIIDTLLPDELRDDAVLDAQFDDLQFRYDSLFVDNGKEFFFKGFQTAEEKATFLSDWQTAFDALVIAINGRYQVTNEISRAFPNDF